MAHGKDVSRARWQLCYMSLSNLCGTPSIWHFCNNDWHWYQQIMLKFSLKQQKKYFGSIKVIQIPGSWFNGVSADCSSIWQFFEKFKKLTINWLVLEVFFFWVKLNISITLILSRKMRSLCMYSDVNLHVIVGKEINKMFWRFCISPAKLFFFSTWCWKPILSNQN